MTHIERIKSLPCILCTFLHRTQESVTEAHHLEHDSRDDDSQYCVVPLCVDCHRGANGYHSIGGERGMVMRYKLNHDDMMKLTIKALEKGGFFK